jgi:hypothetical protein
MRSLVILLLLPLLWSCDSEPRLRLSEDGDNFEEASEEVRASLPEEDQEKFDWVLLAVFASLNTIETGICQELPMPGNQSQDAWNETIRNLDGKTGREAIEYAEKVSAEAKAMCEE